MHKLPILYSFRRCPYAIRARLAIKYSQQKVALREILLKDKPTTMLEASPKGTVPVLVLPNNNVIDESLDIMQWALETNDPQGWLNINSSSFELIEHNDQVFKLWLDKYKYHDRFPENSKEYYLGKCCNFLDLLEHELNTHHFLYEDKITLTDIAIFPFIRQFSKVDTYTFEQLPYPKLQLWLNYFVNQEIFIDSMRKFTPWKESDLPILF